MHNSLKMIEKMDDLLKETDEYIKCATMHADHPKLKEAYIKLAKCHFEGYRDLSECADEMAEQKAATHPEYGDSIKEMIAWHKNKDEERAHHLKERISQIR